MNNVSLGSLGEQETVSYYESQGYRVLARNWRRREGEIDLILGNNRRYVFCEVKTRTSEHFGSPAQAVSMAKRKRIRFLASQWLADEAPGFAREIRFDVSCVTFAASGASKQGSAIVEIIEGAF